MAHHFATVNHRSNTDHGAGEIIEEDTSTPENMAAYLEKLAVSGIGIGEKR